MTFSRDDLDGHGQIRVGEDPDGDTLDPYTRALELENGRLNMQLRNLFRLGTIATLHIEPGDMIVITFPGTVSPDDAKRLVRLAEDKFPDQRFMVLGEGGTVSVVRHGKNDRD